MTVFKLLFKKMQKQPVDVLLEGVLKNFAIFTEKHLCYSLFLIMIIAKFLIHEPGFSNINTKTSENVISLFYFMISFLWNLKSHKISL